MTFIGIISDEAVENSIRREILEKLKLRESSVLFIKEKSIENIKNIKFETIIIDRKFKNSEILKKILENATYVIINADIKNNLSILENIKATVLTYGFNSKATITVSSVEDEEIILCLQRILQTKSGKNIEPQEIRMPICENANLTMALATIQMLYSH